MPATGCSIRGFGGGASRVDRKAGGVFWLAVAWLALVATLAVSAAWWPLPAPDQIDWVRLTAKPGDGHLLGTDNLGRDIAARLLFGARVSLFVGLLAPCVGLLAGGLLGILAGFYRGTIDALIVVVIDTLLAFPRLVLLLVVAFVFGSSLFSLTLSLGIVIAPSVARIVRALTIRIAEREFILAARAAGASDAAIILREVLPNVLMPMLVYMLVMTGLVIVAEGSLGFLGLSVASPMPSWGGMIAEGRDVLAEHPHVSMIPATVMFLTVLAVNLIGDRMRGWLDVRESQL
ncbi:MAG: binding-protein-dependent transport systems inner membrane component [Rhodocyclaceae bacterium]|nr:MAG: binding-protein-dependent transport systems inner membrane component [Rhodocyclaceae bacterium]TND02331.1 MAG: binding-protein-dependent transport systems inner membrane component [Rhodocyclaceae bacterium]